MSAKSNEPAMVQEMYDIAMLTMNQIDSAGIDRASFISPSSSVEDLACEGIILRVLRLTEEMGRLSQETAERYAFETKSARDLRNRLAHAYGSVDRELVWNVVEYDLPDIVSSCKAYADGLGVDLE